MEGLDQRGGGVDGQQATVVAGVRVPGKGRRLSEVRTCDTTTVALWQLADGLTEPGVTHGAIESTGVDWRPGFNVLAGSCEVILVNARHGPAVPGRKSEVKDGAWLAPLLEPGRLRASCVPPRPSRERRALTRDRHTLIWQRASEVHRLQQRRESAHLELGLVATAMLGASGRAILRALVAGERDGAGLATRATGVRRHQRARWVAALTGRFTEPHAALLGERLAHRESLEAASARLRARMADALPPDATPVERWRQRPGLHREAAARLLAAMGLDRRGLPAAAPGAWWAGVCPGNHESAGQRQTGRTRQGHPWRKTGWVDCGWGAGRARRTSVGAP